MAKGKLENLVAVDMKNGFTYIGVSIYKTVSDIDRAELEDYVTVPTSAVIFRGTTSYEVNVQEAYNSQKKSKGPLYLNNVEVKHMLNAGGE